ncbi:MAG: PEP-CTERM sorting domain-containing protein [Limisphaerales bacterium]
MNWFSTLRSSSAILLTLTVLPFEPRAQTTIRANEYVAREHTQTSIDAPVATGEYRFILDQTGSGVHYTLPTGTTLFGSNRVFADLPTLQAEFPVGTYTAVLNREARPGRPASTHTLQADLPADPSIPAAVPRITNIEWNNDVLLVDPNFTLTLDQWAGRPADSMIRLHLQGPNGSHTHTFLNQNATSFTINGDGGYELLPNSTYQAVLSFIDPFATVSTPIPGVSPIPQEQFRFDLGGANSVRFTIVTVPEPRVTALMAAALIILSINKRRRNNR